MLLDAIEENSASCRSNAACCTHISVQVSDLALQHIRVVAVAPKHAANVGAIVRACENFECPNLHVVQPRCDVYSDEVLKLACGSALVSRIVVHDSLEVHLLAVFHACYQTLTAQPLACSTDCTAVYWYRVHCQPTRPCGFRHQRSYTE